jgi:hypothetical protein
MDIFELINALEVLGFSFAIAVSIAWLTIYHKLPEDDLLGYHCDRNPNR